MKKMMWLMGLALALLVGVGSLVNTPSTAGAQHGPAKVKSDSYPPPSGG